MVNTASLGKPIEPCDFLDILPEYGSALRARAVRLTGSRADAADLVQETLARALKSRRRPAGSARVRGWLLTILYNAFLDERRSLAFRNRSSFAAGLLEQLVCDDAPAEPPPWLAIDPEVIGMCCQRLSPSFRQILELHLDGASYAELSRRLGIPIGTVGTRLMRARLRLRKMLPGAAGIELPANQSGRRRRKRLAARPVGPPADPFLQPGRAP